MPRKEGGPLAVSPVPAIGEVTELYPTDRAGCSALAGVSYLRAW